MDAVELNIFSSRIQAVCEEMGAVLQRTAFSPNIKDRLDYSCAVFDAQGELCAQAAHIPVHLGSMAYAMHDIVRGQQWNEGSMVILNDPFLGGTHLPDVTLIAPVYSDHQLVGFVANRAHHADIGCQVPGSMPISKTLDEEGIILPPTLLILEDSINEELLSDIVNRTGNPVDSQGDITAQISANRTGIKRLRELINGLGKAAFSRALATLNDYAERLALNSLSSIPNGCHEFLDTMDDDGCGNPNLEIRVKITARDARMHVDFSGTAKQTPGNINCPISVTAAAAYYVFRSLMPANTPACAGSLRPITLVAPASSLVNATRPAAVAAGNVETSTRIVDVILGALARVIPELTPAASHGSMNNIAMGARRQNGNWDYYETIGGGMGAGPLGGGLHGIQTHMTNTLNTPVEALEMRFPLHITHYGIRHGSGGGGKFPGGDGLVREFEFLEETEVTLLTERRSKAPWGLHGGGDGRSGVNLHNGQSLPGKIHLTVQPGDRLTIETPGGGGWGKPDREK